MLSSELNEKVLSYLESCITLEELEDWYIPRLELFLGDPGSADADIIATIELCLAEMRSGLLDENEARQMLEETLVKYETVIQHVNGETLLSTSSSQTKVDFSMDSSFISVICYP